MHQFTTGERKREVDIVSEQARIDVEAFPKEAAALTAQEEAELVDRFGKSVWFATSRTQSTSGTREPDVEWELTASESYENELATGRAAVYYGEGHSALVRPMIFADGFNYGPSDLPGLWNHVNAPYDPDGHRLFDQLLAAGVDIVLLGFDERHTYIQANAGVAVSCIRRVIQEQQGDAGLIVGGVSMGGMVTRYALARMETDSEDHRTETYLSYDSPHNGAWIPLILQQMAYFFETKSANNTPSQADLIRSPAAQQLLWAWVPDARYSGLVATASPLRQQFLTDLNNISSFPAQPRKLGVANGTGNGTGRNLKPGDVAFDWKLNLLLIVASATARIQPDNGNHQRIGGMHVGLQRRTSDTSWVPAFDGAPGGTLDSFGKIADTLKAEIREEYRDGCFVPSVSAVALDYDPVTWPIDLYTDISTLPPERSHLDDFICDDQNSPHSAITASLATWILERLTH